VKGGRSKAFSVGIVSTIALAIIAAGVFLVGREQRFWEGRDAYWLHFTRTNGLQEGAPVALDGVNIGSVSRMRFPPDPTAQYVEVKISVSSNVGPRIRRDTTARIQTLGLLGDKYIELTSGTLDEPVVEMGGLIRSLDPMDYEALLGQSGDIVSNAIEVTALLRQVLTDINRGEGLVGRLVGDRDFGQQFADDLSLTIANIESATRRLDELFATVESGQGALGTLLVKDEQLGLILDNLELASNNAASFSDQLAHGEGTLQRLVSDDELARETLDSLAQASSSIAQITAKVESGEGSLGKLVYDDDLYDGAERLVTPGGPGGFWRIIGNTLAFFWPFPTGGSADTALAEEHPGAATLPHPVPAPDAEPEASPLPAPVPTPQDAEDP